MAVYSDIITWSNNKAPFIKDAIRRILHCTVLTAQDIQEIKELLKKEHGFEGITLVPSPATNADIPPIITSTNQVRLKQISSPHNISALYESTALNFSLDGLTIVYGKNGSGKSSFSKILKKLCWSRDNGVILKKNVYTASTEVQSVSIKYTKGNVETNFVWQEGQPTDENLNSVYIFDTKCAGIYLNQDNPAEYKPAGIEVLERLLQLYEKLSCLINEDASLLIKEKDELPEKYRNTETYRWYQNLETLNWADIEAKLSLTTEQINHKLSLETSLKDANPAETNKNLVHKLNRYNSLFIKINEWNKLFDIENLQNIATLIHDLLTKEAANKIARESYEEGLVFSIESQAWKTLWEAARNYAISEIHTDHPIGSKDGVEFCMLCQQPLSTDAKTRLQKFESYIQDTTSTALDLAKGKLEQERKRYDNIPNELITKELINELVEDNPIFRTTISEYIEQLINAKDNVLNLIDNKDEDITSCAVTPSLSALLLEEIKKISQRIKTNEEVLANRSKIEKEYLELEALNLLVQKRDSILKYYDEYTLKKKYGECLSALNTRSISTKMGELLETNAIEAQQTLFLQYLNIMNPQIAAKMGLKKTRTTSGITYQKCGFNSISENITEVFSEGEQKIVAIANFLAESNVDNSNNTIVFDDPINSLDMDYREAVAKIIVHLSVNQQVIVFTHDLYFLRILKDAYKKEHSCECYVTCLNSVENHCGIVSDEIPYLVKNVQERIDTIMSGLNEIKSLNITQIDKKNSIINDLKDKMRQLLERTVEDILVNNAISRFSKNISFKRSDLANMILVSKTDIDYLLGLYSKYSEVIHDGSPETVSKTLTETDIHNDITSYKTWKDNFIQNAKNWKKANGYE